MNSMRLNKRIKKASFTVASKTGLVYKKSLIFVVAVLILTFLSQVFVSAMLSGKGDELAKLQQQASELDNQNLALRQELAGKTSITQVALTANQMGLVKPSQILYIDPSNNPVASLR